MIPVAGILAAIAIPAYADYMVRAHVDEGVHQVTPYKTAIEAAAAGGTPWTDISTATLAPIQRTASSHIQDIAVDGGVVHVTFGGQGSGTIDGETLTFTPAVSGTGAVAWVCGYEIPRAGFKAVRADYADGTSIERKYLPPNCR